MAAMVHANNGRASSYGNDQSTIDAELAIASMFVGETHTTWVPTGTAANVTGIGALVAGPGGAVLAGDNAHVLLDECGAIERTWGMPIRAVPTLNGKITPEALEDAIVKLKENSPFSPRPSVLVLAQITEDGRRYSLNELRELAAISASHGVDTHVDGARFANALAEDPEMCEVLNCGISTLALGMCKNGQGPVEVVVTGRLEIHLHAQRAAKQLGYTASKMRYMTAGVGHSITSGEYLVNAENANAMARVLSAGLTSLGCPPVLPVDGNLVFVQLSSSQAEALRQWSPVSIWNTAGLVRLACSWDHTEADVLDLLSGVSEALSENR
jgi:threonine aldolase